MAITPEHKEQLVEKILKGMREEYGAETIDKMISCYNYYKTDEEFLSKVDLPVEFGEAELFIGTLLLRKIHPVMYKDPMDPEVLAMQLSIMNMTEKLMMLDAVIDNREVLSIVKGVFKEMMGIINDRLNLLKAQEEDENQN